MNLNSFLLTVFCTWLSICWCLSHTYRPPVYIDNLLVQNSSDLLSRSLTSGQWIDSRFQQNWGEICCSHTGQYVYIMIAQYVNAPQSNRFSVSKDFGVTWISDSRPSGLYGVRMYCSGSGQYVMFMDTNQTVYLSSNYSDSFVSVPVLARTVANPYYLSTVAISNTGQYMFVSGFISSFQSSDYGVTWNIANLPSSTQVVCSDTGQYVLALAVSSTCYIGGSVCCGTGLHLSSNFGATFQIIASTTARNCDAIFSTMEMQMSSTGKVINLVNSTTAHRLISTNFGASFTSYTSSVMTWRTSASETGQYMVGRNSQDVALYDVVYFSDDFGVSWYSSSSATEVWMVLTMNSDRSRVYAAGQSSLYLYSTISPTLQPTTQATMIQPSTLTPTSCSPSVVPTWMPTAKPTKVPTLPPSAVPTPRPTSTLAPSVSPSQRPTSRPSSRPSSSPSSVPSSRPTDRPTNTPSGIPSCRPSTQPSGRPSTNPSNQPSRIPSTHPTEQPSSHPSSQPSHQPMFSPSRQPSSCPSTGPSSQPTSSPSCSIGSGHDADGVGCSPCPSGTMSSPDDDTCVKCPRGSFSAHRGSIACTDCPYPHTTVVDGQSHCSAYSIKVSFTKTFGIICALVFVIILSVIVGRNRVAMMLNLVYPTLDVFSDLAYLLTNDFFSPILFVLGVFFLLFPVPCFIYTLMEHNAIPSLWFKYKWVWWLSVERGIDHIYYPKFPIFGESGRLPFLSPKRHDNLRMMILEFVVWIVALCAQTVTIIVWFFLLFVNVLFLFVWLILGIFFHMTKVITLGVVWNTWFQLWTGSNEHDTDVDIDTEELNKCLQYEFYYETLPQFVLQLVNNVYLRQLSTLAIVSLAMSVYSGLNGCWKFVYYKYCLDERKELRDIPVDKSIRIRLKWLGIDWTLVNARLEPNSKVLRKKTSPVAYEDVPSGDEEQDLSGGSSDPTNAMHIDAVPMSHDPSILAIARASVSQVVPINDEHFVHSARFDEEDALFEPRVSVKARHDGGENEPLVAFDESVKVVQAVAVSGRGDTLDFTEWLSSELLVSGMTPSEAGACLTALSREGIRSKQTWSLLNEDEFTKAFLTGIGVTALGLQKQLIARHRQLRMESQLVEV